MTRPSDPELLLAYLAGELSAAESATLETRLKAEPALADQFLALARDEAVLAEWAKVSTKDEGRRTKELVPASSSVVLRTSAFVLALAACLLLAMSVYYHTRPVPASSGAVAVVEDAQGEVMLVTLAGSVPVEKGQQLFLGSELRTGGEGSYAVVRYPDAARLELSADTTARLENGTAKTKDRAAARRVYATEGLLTAEVTQMPMVLATPHAEVRSGIGTFVCNIATAGTCVEPEKGRVQVTRTGQPMVEVEAGFYTVANDVSVSKPRQRPIPVTTPLATLTDSPAAPLLCLACSPDGRTLVAAGNDGSVRFWDIAARRLRGSFKAQQQGAVRTLAVAPDGLTLATGGSDRFLHIWDSNNEEKYTLRKQRADIEGLVFSPDGRTLAVACASAKDGIELRLYDVATGLECGALRGTNPKIGVTAVAFGDDHTLATGSRDGVVRLWDMIENPAWSTLRGPGQERFTFRERRVLAAHTLEVRALAFTANGRLLASAGRDGAARIWRTDDGAQLFSLTEHGRDVRSVAFSPDGSLLATTGGDGMARVWQTRDGHEYAVYRAPKHAPMRVVFLADGATLATCGGDRTIKLWKLEAPPLAGGL